MAEEIPEAIRRINELLERLVQIEERRSRWIESPGIPIGSTRIEDDYLSFKQSVFAGDLKRGIPNQVIPPGGALNLLDVRGESGFISLTLFSLSNPMVDLCWSGEAELVRATAFELFMGGDVRPNNSLWVTGYDDIGLIYSVLWVPNPPFRYRGRIRVWIDNKTALPCSLWFAMIQRWVNPPRG